MPLPLIPMAIISLAGGAWYAHKKRLPKDDDATRATSTAIFEQAMNAGLDGSKYRKLAKDYEAQGLKVEADMLIKRARLAEAPPEVKEMRRKLFDQAMASTNVGPMRNVAAEFADLGSMGAARMINVQADKIEKQQADERERLAKLAQEQQEQQEQAEPKKEESAV